MFINSTAGHDNSLTLIVILSSNHHGVVWPRPTHIPEENIEDKCQISKRYFKPERFTVEKHSSLFLC